MIQFKCFRIIQQEKIEFQNEVLKVEKKYNDSVKIICPLDCHSFLFYSLSFDLLKQKQNEMKMYHLKIKGIQEMQEQVR